MNQNLEEVMRRTYRYYYEDGLVEMAVGGLFALIGLVILGYQRAQGNPALVLAGTFGLMAVTAGGVFAVRWVVTRIKDRVTAPRTGLVTHDRKPSPWRWWIIGGTFAIVLIGFFLPEEFTGMPVMEGALLTLILASIGGRVGLQRMLVAALLPLATGVVSVFLGWDELTGSALVFAVTGSLMALMGIAAFIRYLRENPLPQQDEE
jgi:hypothetical protein